LRAVERRRADPIAKFIVRENITSHACPSQDAGAGFLTS
jgi:hypothetical protein